MHVQQLLVIYSTTNGRIVVKKQKINLVRLVVNQRAICSNRPAKIAKMAIVTGLVTFEDTQTRIGTLSLPEPRPDTTNILTGTQEQNG